MSIMEERRIRRISKISMVHDVNRKSLMVNGFMELQSMLGSGENKIKNKKFFLTNELDSFK
jgi:hypothetical protein